MRRAKFTQCYKCGCIQPVRALDGGLCWLCAGLRKSPVILRDKPVEAAYEIIEAVTALKHELESLPTPSNEPSTEEVLKTETRE